MSKKSAYDQKGTRSLKTLFLYMALVFLLILISFSIKAFFVFQKSLFDGRNHFTVAVVKEGKVVEVVSFNPRVPSLALVKIEHGLPLSSLGETLAVAPDAVIQAKENLPVGDDVTGTMMATVWQFATVHTDMTIIDVIRLSLLSKSIQEENKIIKELNLSRQESDIDKIILSFFGDGTISSENLSIRIVNASDIPGIGGRLERVLNNLGCSVIRVATAHSQEQKSKIEYAAEETYTVKKLKRVLKLPAYLQTESTADIVITIGEDSKKATAF
jgi:hypothetical protein